MHEQIIQYGLLLLVEIAHYQGHYASLAFEEGIGLQLSAASYPHKVEELLHEWVKLAFGATQIA